MGIIRYAKLEDISRLVPLQKSCYDALGMERWAEFIPADAERTLYEHISNTNNFGLVAEHEDSLVGCIGILIQPFPANRKYLVANEVGWYVLPDYRKDVGLPMLRTAIKIAKQRGVHRLVFASPPETGLDRVYTRLGFKQIETNYVKDLWQ